MLFKRVAARATAADRRAGLPTGLEFKTTEIGDLGEFMFRHSRRFDFVTQKPEAGESYDAPPDPGMPMKITVRVLRIQCKATN